jgi:dihydrofolate reductase
MTHLIVIVARARNGVIGRDNQLPWHLPEDLKYFKRTTMGAPVIMGRKTHESIGRPLPGRRNLVVTRDASRHFEGCETAGSLEEAVARCERDGVAEAFLIGGAQLYREGLEQADRLLVTEIDRDIEGDAMFPAPDPAVWREVSREYPAQAASQPAGDVAKQPASPSSGDPSGEVLPYAWVCYERKAA